MLEITLDDKQLQRSLGTLLRNAAATRPMMAGLAAEMQSLTEENFERESWGTESWPQSKRAADDRGKTLQDSGQLAAGISTKITKDSARIGSSKPYAAIHHLGGTVLPKNKPYLVFPIPGGGFRKIKRLDIPARPYLPVNKDGHLQPGAERRLLDVALAALKRGV